MEHLVVRDELLRLRSDLAAIAARIDTLVHAFEIDENVQANGSIELIADDEATGFGHLDICADAIALDSIAEANCEPDAVAAMAAADEMAVASAEAEPQASEPVVLVDWILVEASTEQVALDGAVDDLEAEETTAQPDLSAEPEVVAEVVAEVAPEAEVELVAETDIAVVAEVADAPVAEDAGDAATAEHVVDLVAELDVAETADLTCDDVVAEAESDVVSGTAEVASVALAADMGSEIEISEATDHTDTIVAEAEAEIRALIDADLVGDMEPEAQTVAEAEVDAIVAAADETAIVAEIEPAAAEVVSAIATAEVAAGATAEAEDEPVVFDLDLIKGIDQGAKDALAAMDISGFADIAELTSEKIAEIEDRLGAKGRVRREVWIEQAAMLASGQPTKFAGAVKNGTVGSVVACEVVEMEPAVVPAANEVAVEETALEVVPAVTALVPVAPPVADNVVALVPAAERLKAQRSRVASTPRRSGGWTRSIAAALAVAAIGVGAYSATDEQFSRSARERLCQVDMLRDTQACGLIRASMVIFNR